MKLLLKQHNSRLPVTWAWLVMVCGVLFFALLQGCSDKGSSGGNEVQVGPSAPASTTETGSGSESDAEASGKLVISEEAEGVNVGTVTMDANLAYEIPAAPGSRIEGSIAYFPAGALPLEDQEEIVITVEEGASRPVGALQLELDLDSSYNVLSDTPPVLVSANRDIDLLKPMVLSIAIPEGSSAGLALASLGRLAVLYRIHKVKENRVEFGLLDISDSSIVVDLDKQMLFISTYHLGWFQAILLNKAPPERLDAEAVSPILSKRDEGVISVVGIGAPELEDISLTDESDKPNEPTPEELAKAEEVVAVLKLASESADLNEAITTTLGTIETAEAGLESEIATSTGTLASVNTQMEAATTAVALAESSYSSMELAVEGYTTDELTAGLASMATVVASISELSSQINQTHQSVELALGQAEAQLQIIEQTATLAQSGAVAAEGLASTIAEGALLGTLTEDDAQQLLLQVEAKLTEVTRLNALVEEGASEAAVSLVQVSLLEAEVNALTEELSILESSLAQTKVAVEAAMVLEDADKAAELAEAIQVIESTIAALYENGESNSAILEQTVMNGAASGALIQQGLREIQALASEAQLVNDEIASMLAGDARLVELSTASLTELAIIDAAVFSIVQKAQQASDLLLQIEADSQSYHEALNQLHLLVSSSYSSLEVVKAALVEAGGLHETLHQIGSSVAMSEAALTASVSSMASPMAVAQASLGLVEGYLTEAKLVYEVCPDGQIRLGDGRCPPPPDDPDPDELDPKLLADLHKLENVCQVIEDRLEEKKKRRSFALRYKGKIIVSDLHVGAHSLFSLKLKKTKRGYGWGQLTDWHRFAKDRKHQHHQAFGVVHIWVEHHDLLNTIHAIAEDHGLTCLAGIDWSQGE